MGTTQTNNINHYPPLRASRVPTTAMPGKKQLAKLRRIDRKLKEVAATQAQLLEIENCDRQVIDEISLQSIQDTFGKFIDDLVIIIFYDGIARILKICSSTIKPSILTETGNTCEDIDITYVVAISTMQNGRKIVYNERFQNTIFKLSQMIVFISRYMPGFFTSKITIELDSEFRVPNTRKAYLSETEYIEFMAMYEQYNPKTARDPLMFEHCNLHDLQVTESNDMQPRMR